MKSSLGLRTILILLLVSFAVLPLSAVGGLGYVTVSSGIRSEILDNKQATAILAADEIDTFINNSRIAIAAFASQPATGDFADAAAQKAAVDGFKKQYPQFQYVYIMNIDGRITNVAPREGWADWDFGDRDWFKQVKTSTPYLSGSFLSDATKQSMVFTVCPIVDGKNQVIGAVGANIDLQAVSQGISAIKAGETGYAFAIDGQGIIIAHPDRAKVLTQERFESSLVKDVLSGKSGTGEYVDGTAKLSAYAPVKSLGWGVFFTQDKTEALSVVGKVLNSVLIVLGISVLVALLLGLFVSGSVVRPITNLAQVAGVLAEGDFSQEIVVSGYAETRKLAAAFARMQGQLRHLIQKISSNAHDVAASSQQLAASAEQVGQSVNQVSRSMQEIARGSQDQAVQVTGAMSYVNEMVNEVAATNEHVQAISVEAQKTRQQAAYGKQQADKSVDQMGAIASQVGQAAEALRALDQSSKEIGQIVGFITNIAGQTNLLALNAAIEAARAGESGRGFAVVASEVRKLAEEAANSASQIARIVRVIQEKTKECTTIMDDSTRQVDDGSHVISEAGVAFDAITTAVNELAAKIDAVAAGAAKMVDASAQAKKKVETIATIGQQAAAGAQEVSASVDEQTASVQEIAGATEELARLAQKLQHDISAFRV